MVDETTGDIIDDIIWCDSSSTVIRRMCSHKKHLLCSEHWNIFTFYPGIRYYSVFLFYLFHGKTMFVTRLTFPRHVPQNWENPSAAAWCRCGPPVMSLSPEGGDGLQVVNATTSAGNPVAYVEARLLLDVLHRRKIRRVMWCVTFEPLSEERGWLPVWMKRRHTHRTLQHSHWPL